MPLQNRVTPEGEIVATPARGTMYGVRGGCFHRDDGTLRPTHWAGRGWICCVLAFKGRRRKLRQPGLYTELFFLDEATAFAAGHRPCFECRREAAVRYRQLWAAAFGLDKPPSAPEMDARLHAERLLPDGGKRIWRSRLGALPDGAFVRIDASLCLVSKGALFAWSHEGYAPAATLPADTHVDVLTPSATVAILTAGYRPMLHPSFDHQHSRDR